MKFAPVRGRNRPLRFRLFAFANSCLTVLALVLFMRGSVRIPTSFSRQPREMLDVISLKNPDKVASGPVDIDEVHVRGLIHRGVWVCIFDRHLQLLMQFRGPNMATCAGALAILGEHVKANESFGTAAARGVLEELSWLSVDRLVEAATPFYYDFEFSDRFDRQWTKVFVGRVHDFGDFEKAVNGNEENVRFERVSVVDFVRITRERAHAFCSMEHAKWFRKAVSASLRTAVRTWPDIVTEAGGLREAIEQGEELCCSGRNTEDCGVPCRTEDATNVTAALLENAT